jgi:hypothetical protein
MNTLLINVRWFFWGLLGLLAFAGIVMAWPFRSLLRKPVTIDNGPYSLGVHKAVRPSSNRTRVVVYSLVAVALVIVAAIANRTSGTPVVEAGAEATPTRVGPTPTDITMRERYSLDASLPGRPDIDAHFPRWDACRTYNIGGVDATDGIACSLGAFATVTAAVGATPEGMEVEIITITTTVTVPPTETVTAPPPITETTTPTPELPTPTPVPPTQTPVPTTPVVTEPPATEEPCENGNPGNLKCVGNAGEDPNGHGTMPEDNAGGDGNGEHGNQGTNPNSPFYTPQP